MRLTDAVKKLLCIISLLTCTGVANAQQTMLFKIKYLPNHTYRSITIKTRNDPFTIGHFHDTTSIAYEVKTGALKQGALFGADFKYLSYYHYDSFADMFDFVSTKENQLKGQMIYGQCGANGRMTIDSLSAKANNASINKSMAEMVNLMQESLKFPDKTLRVGDTFTQVIAMDPDLINAPISETATYKLVSVENDLAYFDITHAIAMDTISDRGTIKRKLKGAGTGSGKMVFNIKESFPVLFTSDIAFAIDVFTDKGNGTIATRLTTSTKNEIIKN